MSQRNEIHLLVVDDDDKFRGMMAHSLSRQGYRVREATSGDEALSLGQRWVFDVAVFVMKMEGSGGIELLEKFTESHPECEFLVLTGQGTIETAVQAMKLGAYDFLTKPVPIEDLQRVIAKAYERGQLRRENVRLRTLLERHQPKLEMIGRSAAMQELFRLIERAGPSDKAILIQGESGTGKELVARALHQCSRRADKPMVVINCAALPETLLESELFGHEKGAFTGAVSSKAGLFETADGGTLFVDEIGEIPGALQAKLLRVLEDGSLRRVGSLKERRVDVRLLASTNREMAKEVAEGRFREDLYYRINVMSLELPPLRQRSGDIPLLVAHLLGPSWDIDDDALHAIEQFHWPGNVRQLINAMERAKILADDQIIRLRDLPREVVQYRMNLGPSARLHADDLSLLERNKVIEVMRREAGNKSRAANTLGIDRRKLYRLIAKYQIRPEEVSGESDPGGPDVSRRV